MKILMNPVAQKPMATEDVDSFRMLNEIIKSHKEDASSLVHCLQKYMDEIHEIPVQYYSSSLQ